MMSRVEEQGAMCRLTVPVSLDPVERTDADDFQAFGEEKLVAAPGAPVTRTIASL